jgi:hypothetical protein
MRKLSFTLMLLACTLASAATVYRWVDENGVIHYSDQPHPNAEKLSVHAAQTYKASEGPQLGTPNEGGGARPQQQGPAYQGCAILQPADAQDFANLDSLNIVVGTDPPLHNGDQVFITVDGQPVNNGAPTNGQFTLTPVDRGQHTVSAAVRDPSGTVLCQTPSITFNVHQPSTQNPVSPVRPH